MGMADMLVNRLEELSSQIDALHLMYLELDDSPKKIEQRERLEMCIKEFLCLAPHDMKFAYRHTADVLHRSASTKDNFSGYRAGVAWKALGKYADNLLAQPWRKEYREIKLYCGFYKHEIEANLVGAELMLEAMGYRHSGNSTMILPDILDPDRITNVSRDAIIAYVECQIMKQIWEAVCSRYNFSWLDILEFRENHTGTPDQAIKALNYKARQRQYQEQSYHRTQHIRSIPDTPMMSHPECYYGQNMMAYNNHMHYLNHSYTLPMQPRYANLMSPQQVVPPTMMCPAQMQPYQQTSQVLKPQDFYPTNGYHTHSQYTQMNTMQGPNPHNGYSPQMHVGSVMPTYTAPATVPTAQLIEVDMIPTHVNAPCSDPYIGAQRNNISKSNQIERHLPESVVRTNRLENQTPSGRARDDGTGSWESWDYVYRNLESQGYKKDMGSRGDLLSPKEPEILSDLPDRMRKVQLEPNTNIVVSRKEVTKPELIPLKQEQSLKEETNVQTVISEIRDTTDFTTSKTDLPDMNRSSPQKIKKETIFHTETVVNIPDSRKVDNEKVIREKELRELEVSNTKKKEEIKKSPPVTTRRLEKGMWSCVTCTFLNPTDRDICEMCSKSKTRGAEFRPQPTGGQVCPRCTLVNEPGHTTCSVCDHSLENSPTYI